MGDLVPAVLDARQVSKRFGAITALRSLSFDIAPGEIHALLGENGAGKSTFIKILAGVYSADSGQMRIDGRPVDEGRPAIGFIHQDLALIPTMSASENFAQTAGYSRRFMMIDWRATRRRADDALRRVGLNVSADVMVGDLGVGERALVAIARALVLRCRLLVLDEPTASLVASDAERLFDALRALRNEGLGILYVSHRLPEVKSLADRITVLRDGEAVATTAASQTSEREIAELIVGRKLARVERHRPEPGRPQQPEALTIDELRCPPVDLAGLRVRRGQVLGITGLRGSGHELVGRALFGLEDWSGRATLNGKGFHPSRPSEALRRGVAYVIGDRTLNGVPTMTIAQNIFLNPSQAMNRRWLRSPRSETERAAQIVAEFGIRPPHPDRTLAELSGGNWQKVAFARSLESHPALLILDDPTAGVDVGARADFYTQVRSQAAAGAAVIMISSDYEEMAALCDRVVVLAHGIAAADLRGADISVQNISAAAMEGSTA